MEDSRSQTELFNYKIITGQPEIEVYDISLDCCTARSKLKVQT